MIDRKLSRLLTTFTAALCFLAIAAYPADVLGQDVRGTVTDADTGEPMPGVNVVVQGMMVGTTTDAQGNYALTVPSDDAVLVFSFVGYKPRNVLVEGRTEIDVALEEAVGVLDEMVVIGYGATERRTVTTSISRVENEDLDQMPVGQPAEALMGRLAGVEIRQERNLPGSSPTIRVRGPSSISATNDPLIVIDGIPGGSLNSVNMNDIESVQVLKGASAAAIYGSRGSGGVVIITTKSGMPGEKPQLSFNTYVGMQYPMTHGVENWVSGGEEYRQTLEKYINREWIWQGGDPDIPMWGDDRRSPNYQVNPVVAEGNYNWEDIMFNPAPIQNYHLSVSGLTDAVNYYVSGVYKSQDGVMPNNWYKQYSLRANVFVNITDDIRADFRVSPSYSHGRDRGGSIQNSIKMPPFVEPKINPETGKYYAPRDYWGYRVSAANNPLDQFGYTFDYYNGFTNIAEGKLGFDILEGLVFETTLGATLDYDSFDNFSESRATNRDRVTGSAGDSRDINLLNENVLRYNTTFNDAHRIGSVVGASYQRANYRSTRISAINNSFQNEIIRTLNNAVASPSSNSYMTRWGLASYFARVNYDYNGKYMLSLAYRTDGSSRFGPANRWGSFPSASAGWDISQESFMQGIPALNELKLRASYGEVGNFGIGNFQYLGSISNVDYLLDGQLVQGQIQNSFGNENLRWETTKSAGVGLDVTLFDQRLNVVLDYYNQYTSDLLYSVSIPSISGFTNTLVNVGNVRNRGVEMEVNTLNLTGPFEWETFFNFSRNRNEVTDLHRDVTEVINLHSRGMGWILREGEPMFSYYGYEMIGVHQDEASLENNPHKPGAPLGSAMYKDQNGDGEITEADRVILGNFMPDWQFGMTNRFRWNNLDLSFTLQAKLGALRYNLENLYYQGPTVSAFLRPTIEGQWWSPDDPGTGQPATTLAYLDYVSDTDYYLEPADFLAVRNINFGYTLPGSLVRDFGVDQFRIYLSVQNPFLFTRDEFLAYNPEGFTAGGISGTRSLPGYNVGSEPINRTVVLGINMDF